MNLTKLAERIIEHYHSKSLKSYTIDGFPDENFITSVDCCIEAPTNNPHDWKAGCSSVYEATIGGGLITDEYGKETKFTHWQCLELEAEIEKQLNRYGCMNLGARIHEYREDYPIVTRMIKVPSGKWVARYRLIKVGSIVIYHGEFYKVTKKRVGCCMESISIVSGIVHIRKKKYASSKRVHIDDLS